MYFLSYVYTVTKNFGEKKNSTMSKNLQNFFKTCKKDVIFLLSFKKLQETFQFFKQIIKRVSIFLTKCD